MSIMWSSLVLFLQIDLSILKLAAKAKPKGVQKKRSTIHSANSITLTSSYPSSLFSCRDQLDQVVESGRPQFKCKLLSFCDILSNTNLNFSLGKFAV